MNTSPLVEVTDLVKEYPIHMGLLDNLRGRTSVVHAISGVSLQIAQGEILGLVGESGCGKTTLGKILVRLEQPTRGSVCVGGLEVNRLDDKAMRTFRRQVQMIFQDPYDSLNPRRRILQIVSEPLRYLGLADPDGEKGRIALQQVELNPPEVFASRLPHQLSGGQRQRVAIARSLVVQPRFIVADEPVSMLDVSVRAGVLNLLRRLNTEMGIAILLITHDLATARHLCRRIAVMYLGKLVEMGNTDELVARPRHPYTRLLLASVPDLYRPALERLEFRGEVASALAPPEGCRFWPRCAHAIERCRVQEPIWRELTPGYRVACHRADEI